MNLMLGGLSGCEETGLIDQAWSNADLQTAWRQQRREGKASLTITAAIPGAHAYLDGLFLGGLPVTIKSIPAGRHQCEPLAHESAALIVISLHAR